MIDTWDYEGHTPAPWTVRRGQRNTVLIESNSWGCSDCGNTNIYTYENTNGKEICFPESAEPDPFIMPEQTDRGRPMCYCESCDLMCYADKVDATQNDNDLALIADAPKLLAEVEMLYEKVKDYDACLQNLWDNELIPEDTDIWDEVKELLEVD